MKRSKPMKRTPMKKYRAKPRPGRLKGADMEKLREEVYIRDHGLCQTCGCRVLWDEWELSHIRGKRMWGDSPETTEVSCKPCHRRFHSWGPSLQKPVPAKDRA